MDNSKPLPVSQKPWWLGRGGAQRSGHSSNDGDFEPAGYPAAVNRENARKCWDHLRASKYVD
jgi:hypothetical protein